MIRPEPGSAEERELLEAGEIEVLGRMPWSSNATFLIKLERAGVESLAIYKPRKGERPLWDFPRGTLCAREVAAHVVSEALGWGIVPLTILRDGPAGIGMVQRFVEHDPEEHYFTLRERFADVFRRFALFDVVINNADRKSGHCLRDETDHVWGIDHGVSFHGAVKLRTVIWDFAGQELPQDLCGDIERTLIELERGALKVTFDGLLSAPEVRALKRRLRSVLDPTWRFPEPTSAWSIPWPPV